MEIMLKECPCCGGEAKFEKSVYDLPKKVRAICTKCKLSTEWVKESLDYCAKEEVAKTWNKRKK